MKKISLNEAINTGLKNNPEVRMAQKSIIAAKGRFWSGISLPQPQVSLSYEYAQVHKSLSSYGEKTLEIQQSLEFPTNYFLRGSRLSKEEQIVCYQLYITEQQVTRQIKSSYYHVLVKQYQVQSAKENLEISKDFYKKAEIRQNVGEGTNLEKLTAKVQYSQAINELENAKNELSGAYSGLNYTLGYGKQYENDNYTLTDSLVYIDFQIDRENVYKLFDNNSPVLKIAELNTKIASLDKGMAWSSVLPELNVGYLKQTIDGNTGFYGATFGISLPLWFMFDHKGKIQEAAANHNISEYALQHTKNELYLQLKSSFTDLDNNNKQVGLYLNDILPQAREIYLTAEKSYDAGELSYLEFLQAKQILISSRNHYINALFNYYQSVFAIEELTGINFNDKPGMEK